MAENQEELKRITIEVPEDFRLKAHGAVRMQGYETLKDFIVEKLQEAINKTQQPIKATKKS